MADVAVSGQDFTLARSGDWRVRFVVAAAAAATDADWYMAADMTTPADEHDMSLTVTDGGIILTPQGGDLLVDLVFANADTETLPRGYRWHELWLTVEGKEKPWATGIVTIVDTLRGPVPAPPE